MKADGTESSLNRAKRLIKEIELKISKISKDLSDETDIQNLINEKITELKECVDNLKSGKTAVSFTEFHIIKEEIVSFQDLNSKKTEAIKNLNILLTTQKEELAKLQMELKALQKSGVVIAFKK
jgi:chromosome segregation ATPase